MEWYIFALLEKYVLFLYKWPSDTRLFTPIHQIHASFAFIPSTFDIRQVHSNSDPVFTHMFDISVSLQNLSIPLITHFLSYTNLAFPSAIETLFIQFIFRFRSKRHR